MRLFEIKLVERGNDVTWYGMGRRIDAAGRYVQIDDDGVVDSDVVELVMLTFVVDLGKVHDCRPERNWRRVSEWWAMMGREPVDGRHDAVSLQRNRDR